MSETREKPPAARCCMGDMNASPEESSPTPGKEMESRVGHTAYYSVVLDRSASELWDVVRDFNNYPIYVNGVTESHIEDGLSGTTVGSFRDFAMGDVRTRQRLLAHSDGERYFSYQSCGPTTIVEAGNERTMLAYVGTLRLRTIVEGNRCFAEWSSEYACPPEDANYWAAWWANSLPAWLSSIREHLAS